MRRARGEAWQPRSVEQIGRDGRQRSDLLREPARFVGEPFVVGEYPLECVQIDAFAKRALGERKRVFGALRAELADLGGPQKRSDTLGAIAKKYYGNAGKYPVIFEANQPLLTDPDRIYPGQVLRIPPQS